MSDRSAWRGMTRAELDRAYDNRGAVADSGACLEGWESRSARFRQERGGALDVGYGPRDRNRIDVFRCGAERAPLLVFIHGGYWQRGSKEAFACLVEGPLALGMDVAMPGYTLGPEATVGEMILEIRAAIGFLRSNGPSLGVAQGRLVVSGWSAGGHLAVMAGGEPGVDAVMAISGIFDLEPCRLGALNDKLLLDSAQVDAVSPARVAQACNGPLVLAYGMDELPELRRQSEDFAPVMRQRGATVRLLPLAGRNHFSIMEELMAPDGALAREALQLAGEGRSGA